MQTLTFKTQQVRVREFQGKVWFSAVDVTRILGYKNSAQAVADNVSDKHICQICLGEKGRSPTFISEPGLYELILKSRLPAAVEFKDWVCEEVLPAIRQTGRYVGQMPIEKLDGLAAALPQLLGQQRFAPPRYSFAVKDWVRVDYGNGNLRKCQIMAILPNYIDVRFEDGTYDIVTATQIQA